LADQHSGRADFPASPRVGAGSVEFLLHDHRAARVNVLGSWDAWAAPGVPAQPLEAGLWQATLPRPRPGTYFYKFLLDGREWLADPANPERAHDGFGAWNSVLQS